MVYATALLMLVIALLSLMISIVVKSPKAGFMAKRKVAGTISRRILSTIYGGYAIISLGASYFLLSGGDALTKYLNIVGMNIFSLFILGHICYLLHRNIRKHNCRCVSKENVKKYIEQHPEIISEIN